MKNLFCLTVCNILAFASLGFCQDDVAVAATEVATEIESTMDITVGGNSQGWVDFDLSDFSNVNCKKDTWSWKEGMLSCNGNCIGVLRSNKQFENFELMLDWKHHQAAGNSGVFLWTPETSLTDLGPDALPDGIECQILDHGYVNQYEQQSGKKADWFTTNGDVFPVGEAKMKPFEPLSPDGVRSFPSSDHSNGFGEWNRYFIRAINGEVRLWVNGHEVSGGNQCKPATGFLCLESEGAPIDFRNIKIRILP